MKVIGLAGLARSGKSTAAAHLVSHHGYVRVRFADPLKAMMRAIGLGHAEVDGDLKETPCAILMGATPRRAMQTLGTDWARDCIHPDFWISLWQRSACDILDHGGKVVVDDVRFQNEVDMIKRVGGTVVRVDRAGLERSSSHVSENFDFAVDQILKNDGSVDDLFRRVDGVLRVSQTVAA